MRPRKRTFVHTCVCVRVCMCAYTLRLSLGCVRLGLAVTERLRVRAALVHLFPALLEQLGLDRILHPPQLSAHLALLRRMQLGCLPLCRLALQRRGELPNRRLHTPRTTQAPMLTRARTETET